MENRDHRRNLTGGILLILLGLFFLANQFYPQFINQIFGGGLTWPLIIVGVGVIFLLSALIGRTGGLAVPGTIITGIGGLLYYQNYTGDWASWAFAWTLIPAFVGLGMLISSLLGEGGPRARRVGAGMLLGWLVVFAILASLFRTGLGMQYVWPAIIILIGLWILVRGFMRRA